MAKKKLTAKQVRDALGHKSKRKKRKDAKPKKGKKKKKKKGGKSDYQKLAEFIIDGGEKKPDPKDLKQYFCLAVSLKGTTPAVIKAKTLKQAHWIYWNQVILPAKKSLSKKFKEEGIKKKGYLYFDEDIYIERMRVWKKYKGYPICSLAADIEVIKFRFAADQYDDDLSD